MPLKVIIVGAGIGGLTTSLALRQAGWDVQVSIVACHLSLVFVQKCPSKIMNYIPSLYQSIIQYTTHLVANQNRNPNFLNPYPSLL